MVLHDTPYLEQVREEYEKITKKWLFLHFRLLVGLVGASVLLELIMFFVLNSIQFITTELEDYVAKYLLIPAGINAVLLLLAALLFRSRRLSFLHKQYAVSLCTLAVCFVLFTIHSVFPSLAMLFAVSVFLTTIYGNYILTSMVAGSSLLLFCFSSLFLFWDQGKKHVLSDKSSAINFVLSLLLLLGFYFICLTIIFFQRQKNQVLIQKELERQRLKAELLRDSLTGLYNRNALREAFNEMLRSNQEHVFAMVDLDHFKQLNDTYGHPRGDICLREFAEIAQQEADPHPVFRYGGDEFCILFYLKDPQTAAAICRRIRQRLDQSTTLAPLSLQASFGLAMYRPGMTPQQLLSHADQALYHSKGKNGPIVIFHDDITPHEPT